MNKQNPIDKFYSYLDELDQGYSRLADLLRQKLVALEQFDIDRLDEIMKGEQVYVMLSKGFDGNLDFYREKLSLKGATLREVIEELPEEERPRFSRQMERLSTTLDNVKALNEKCRQFIETRLYSLDKAIREAEHTGAKSYNNGSGSKPASDSGPHFFTKSV